MMKQVTIPTHAGLAQGYLFTPPGGEPRAATLLFMDAIGLRPAIADIGERLAAAGYLVLAPDTFYRSGSYGPFDPIKVTSDFEALKPLLRLNRALTTEMILQDAHDFVAALDAFSPGPLNVGAVGYCSGGRCAILTAAALPARVRAAAAFHGGELALDRPDSPHTMLDRVKARVYFGIAEIDDYFQAEEEGRLAGALRACGVDHVIETYAGARHGFAIGDVPAFNPQAAEKHWRRLLDLFGEMPPA